MKMKMLVLIAGLLVAQFAFAAGPVFHDPNATVTAQPTVASARDASSNVIVLDFEGMANFQPVGNFYNGGAGVDYGVSFSDNALATIDQDAGGSGNFANEPSPSTVMSFMMGAPIMNVTAGFTTGFSFYYTSTASGSVSLYDGVNGTGNLLGTHAFAANIPSDPVCAGDPTGYFCHWDVVGIPFSGTALSVVFTGVQDQCGFDDVTFGSATPGDIPTLNEWGIIILVGLLAAGSLAYRRKKEELS